jgi:hypothetical protein
MLDALGVNVAAVQGADAVGHARTGFVPKFHLGPIDVGGGDIAIASDRDQSIDDLPEGIGCRDPVPLSGP